MISILPKMLDPDPAKGNSYLLQTMLNRFNPVAVVACPLKALMLLSMAVRAARTTAPACPKNLDFLAY
jgi:hypothetical protein